MKILYVCHYDTSGYTGKNRATRQKLAALSRLVESLTILDIKTERSWTKPLLLVATELGALRHVLTKRPDAVISRGFVGALFQPVARKLGITTVREIHADLLGELHLLQKSPAEKLVLALLARVFNRVDLEADVRLFNHPDLLEWYQSIHGVNPADGYVYNGYDPASASTLTRAEARARFNFDGNGRYAVFTGGASRWHGVQYLVELQKELNARQAGITIVCGGGAVEPALDPEGVLRNITPLDDAGCANLIAASDVCLLPVQKSRVSPGSPLKLYDYIVGRRPVVSQVDTRGYSDEVERYQSGFVTDFTDARRTADALIQFLSETPEAKPDVDPRFSWNARMESWLEIIHKFSQFKAIHVSTPARRQGCCRQVKHVH